MKNNILEFSISGWFDKPYSDYPWYDYDMVIAEGETVQELLEDAAVFTCDQDGGEGPSVKLEELEEDIKTIIVKHLVELRGI